MRSILQLAGLRPVFWPALAATVLATAGLAPGATAPGWSGHQAETFALVVGNNHAGEGFARLRYAHRDAEKIRDVLIELGGLRAERTRSLLGGGRDDLLEAMRETDAAVRKAKSAGVSVKLVFFYSGHAKDGHLLLDGSRLSMNRVRRWLAESAADIRVAFFDACQSGEITRMKGGRPAPSMVELEQTRGQIIVTSSAASEGSQESDEIGGSFFTHYLASGLRGAADHSGDGQVSLREAYEYAYNQTVNRTAGSRGGIQHPSYDYDLAGRGEIVLTRIAAPSCAIRFPSPVAGDFLVYDLDKRRLVAEIDKAAGRARTIGVHPGKFAIKKRRARDLLLGEYELQRGQTLVVRESDLRAVAFEEDTTKGLVVLHEKTSWVAYSLRLGGEAFFDAPTREDLFYSSAQVGVQVEFIGLFSPCMSLAFDLLIGGGKDDTRVELDGGLVQSIPASFLRIQVGTALHFHYDREWWGIYAGPRLTFLIANRELGEPMGHWPAQTFSTLSPGLSAGAVLHLGNFDLFLEGRVHYLYYNLDEDASLGFGGGYFGVAYRH